MVDGGMIIGGCLIVNLCLRIKGFLELRARSSPGVPACRVGSVAIRSNHARGRSRPSHT